LKSKAAKTRPKSKSNKKGKQISKQKQNHIGHDH